MWFSKGRVFKKNYNIYKKLKYYNIYKLLQSFKIIINQATKRRNRSRFVYHSQKFRGQTIPRDSPTVGEASF
jgi:hypothetical protein